MPSDKQIAREIVRRWEGGNPIDPVDAESLAESIATALAAARQPEQRAPPPEGELLPCPFCGAAAGDVKLSRGHGFIIGCSSCQGQQFALERDEAVRMWNARERDELREALEECVDEIESILITAGWTMTRATRAKVERAKETD